MGIYLFGSQWQREMARGIGVNDHLVRRWLLGERPISVRASMAIEGLVDDKSRLLVRDAGVSFIGAVGSLSDTGLRDRLLTSHLEYIHRLIEHGSTARATGRRSSIAPVARPQIKSRPQRTGVARASMITRLARSVPV